MSDGQFRAPSGEWVLCSLATIKSLALSIRYPNVESGDVIVGARIFVHAGDGAEVTRLVGAEARALAALLVVAADAVERTAPISPMQFAHLDSA